MGETDFQFIASDDKEIFVRVWKPDTSPRAIVLLVHGMLEYSARYEEFAHYLVARGLEVMAPDLRGHGKTALKSEFGQFDDFDGHARVTKDLYELSLEIKSRNPETPFFLFGHSMGSFFAQECAERFGSLYSGCMLSGTTGKGKPIAFPYFLARLGCTLRGPRARSPFLTVLSLGSLSLAFKTHKSLADWVSRDPDVLTPRLHDPLTDFIYSTGFYRDLFSLLIYIHRADNLKTIPKDLPIYVFCGSDDPVGAAYGLPQKLVRRYRKLGIRDVEMRIYPGGRHEMLNEINKEEVMADCAAWFDRIIP